VLSSGKLDATDAISGTIAAGNIANDSLTSATTYGSVTGGVPAVASDPPSPAEGDIWYNTTTGTLRFRGKVEGWATGGNLNTTRFNLAGSGTSNTASLAFGGNNPTVPATYAITESYNGSAWTEVNDLNTARGYLAGNGSQTSALAISGNISPPLLVNNESWDGTSWTEVGDVNTARYWAAAAAADNTSAIFFGGSTGSVTGATESWNGTSWTEVNDLNVAREALAGFGTQTSAISSAGSSTGITSNAESWNGTTWTALAPENTNTARYLLAGAGADNTSGIVFGGSNPGVPVVYANTEVWNGTTWTEDTDLNTARQQLGGSGTQASALGFGGEGPGGRTNATEEWGAADTTFTVG